MAPDSRIDLVSVLPENLRESSAAARINQGRALPGKVVVMSLIKNLHGEPRIRTRWVQGSPHLISNAAYGSFGVSYALSGEADYVSPEGEEMPLQPGDLYQLIMEPGQPRPQVRPRTRFHECVFYIDGRLGQSLENHGLWDRSWTVAHVGCKPAIVEAFVELFDGIMDHSLPANAVCRRAVMLYERLHTWMRATLRHDDYVARACRILRENPQPGFTMEEAASLVGMQYNTFRKHFKKQTGISPSEFQLRERMDYAKQLLESHSVKETAALLGYNDPFCFSHQFKKVTGVAPSNYTG